MEIAHRSPLIECFRQGGVPLDVRLMAARGGYPTPLEEQVQLLAILARDADARVVREARATFATLPADAVAALLARPDVPEDLRAFCAGGAPEPLAPHPLAAHDGGPALEASGHESEAPGGTAGDGGAGGEADAERIGTAQRLGRLTVAERIKVAIQGTREERAVLVRDPNRMVSAAVLSSPKLTESEVETIARMTNVSDEVLRVLGSNRTWTKNYSVVAALVRNAKTPIGVALTLLPRLTERDVKMLSTDRNIPEPVRLSARKIHTRGAARRQ